MSMNRSVSNLSSIDPSSVSRGVLVEGWNVDPRGEYHTTFYSWGKNDAARGIK